MGVNITDPTDPVGSEELSPTGANSNKNIDTGREKTNGLWGLYITID